MLKSCVTVSLVEEARGGPFVFHGDLSNACATAHRLGYDAIEIFPPGPEAIDSKTTRELLDAHQLKLAAVGTGAGWVKHRLQLADPNPPQRQRAIEFVKTIIDAAAQLGAMAIIGSMQGRHGEGVSAEAARDYLREGLQICGTHAAQYGQPLIYEPLNRYETNQVNTLEQGCRLLSELSTENVKLLADLFHMQIEEADSAGAILHAAGKIGHVHFVDSNRHPAGQGQIDFSPIFAALRTIKYDGYLSAEAFPRPDSVLAAARTMDAFRYFAGRIQGEA